MMLFFHVPPDFFLIFFSMQMWHDKITQFIERTRAELQGLDPTHESYYILQLKLQSYYRRLRNLEEAMLEKKKQ